MIIERDFKRTEEDDFKLNVQTILDRNPLKEAMPIMRLPPGCYIAGREMCYGWKIQFKYE